MSAATFVCARPLVLVYCGAQCVLYATLAFIFPETHDAAAFVIAGHIGLFVSRIAVGCISDQRLAQWRFSCCWVGAYAIVDGGLWLADRRSKLITGLSVIGMCGILVLAMLQSVHMRAIGLHRWARLGSVACSVALFAALPEPWSELGKPYEALAIAVAHVAGELHMAGLPDKPDNEAALRDALAREHAARGAARAVAERAATGGDRGARRARAAA